MTGYLSSVVERISPGGQRVRPRPISLFEPQGPAGDARWGAVTGAAAEAPETGEVGEPAPEARAPGATQTTHRTERISEPTRALQKLSRPRRPRREPESDEAARSPERLGYLVAPPAAAIEGLSGERTEQPAPEARSAKKGSSERWEGREDRVDRVDRPQPRGTAPRRVTRPPQPATASAIRVSSPERGQVPQKPTPVQPRRSVRGKPPPAGRTIEVTIGRIEVIAVPPSQPAKAAVSHRPSAVMSLEGYLKSREEERQP
jgi:hypothetical protein